MGDSLFPWRAVWRAKSPPQVAFFMQKIVKGKIITTIYGSGLLLSQIGLVCVTLMERQLTIYFYIARQLKNNGVYCGAWVMSRQVSDLLLSWTGLYVKKRQLPIWRVTTSLMRTLWRERNSRVFEDKEGRWIRLGHSWLTGYSLGIMLSCNPMSVTQI